MLSAGLRVGSSRIVNTWPRTSVTYHEAQGSGTHVNCPRMETRCATKTRRGRKFNLISVQLLQP